jgi:hypothetical protein
MPCPLAILAVVLLAAPTYAADHPIPPLPDTARLVLDEDWSSNKIDLDRWYLPRRMWGQGNHGVTPDNVRLAPDTVNNHAQTVLVCEAHGDRYDGPVAGYGGDKTRVGSMIVSKAFFASGRFQVVMKIGSVQPHDGAPADPRLPIGTVPAIWTYAYRYVSAPRERRQEFAPGVPPYNPLMRVGGRGNEYWSELDFPEFGKNGKFDRPLYNTFCQNRHEPKEFNVTGVADGNYHTFTTEWRTQLKPLPNITDSQVVQQGGLWWINDKSVPFDQYLGNPLKRLDKDKYALYAGDRVDHWIDGRKVAENSRFVPSMAAQLTLGVWLPKWAGEAPWSTTTISFASVKVWQFDDPGDVRNILTEDVPDNFTQTGHPTR